MVRPLFVSFLVASWALNAVAQEGPNEASIIVSDSYRLKEGLRDLPVLDSYHLILENVAQPVIYQLEESGGFSDIDFAKFSIYGDSWVWNRWYLDGIDITDTFNSGAAAFYLPFALVGELQLDYRENPEVVRDQGVSLKHRVGMPRSAGLVVAAPNAGGMWLLARPVMDLISGKHAVDRSAPPPAERRRFMDTYELSLSENLGLSDYDVQLGLHAQAGQRRYLEFQWSGRLKETFDEAFSVTSLGVHITPKNSPWSAWFVAEDRRRDRLFAEIHHSPSETAKLSKSTVFMGLTRPGLRFGLTMQQFRLSTHDWGAAREAFDPDGESLSPTFVAGRYRTLALDASAEQGPVYGSMTLKMVQIDPSRKNWTTPVLFKGEAYGRWDFEAAPSAQFFGDSRLGWAQAFDLGGFKLHPSFYGFSTYATAKTSKNALALFDLGAKVLVQRDLSPKTRLFVSLARTPVAVSAELTRLIDPDYLSTERTLLDGTLTETPDGAHVQVDEGLSPTDVYSGAIGARWMMSPRLRLESQGIFKFYKDTMRLDLNGDASAYGRTADGVYYWQDGPTQYRLQNVTDDTPLAFGLHFQLVYRVPELRFLSVGFSAFNAVGRAPFGNGPNANDIGIVNFEGANPNSRINNLANLDSDRGFAVKANFGQNLGAGFWGIAVMRFRDGTPFSFFDYQESEGQFARTYHSKRGSPLKAGRPLDGPREDFHINLDVQLRWQGQWAGTSVTAFVLATNLLDMGNEIQEVNGPDGTGGRSALEQQIPRALFFGLTLAGL